MLCAKCQEEMTGLNNLFDRFSTSPELEIPVRITDRAATARKDFEASRKFTILKNSKFFFCKGCFRKSRAEGRAGCQATGDVGGAEIIVAPPIWLAARSSVGVVVSEEDSRLCHRILFSGE